MFKVGDKVVCVDLSDSYLDNKNLKYLKLYEIYTINISSEYIISLKEISLGIYFRTDRFISLKEYRKQKLEKICLNQAI